MSETLKYCMVGGGPGSFIGEIHRKAIELAGGARLVAAAFSRDLEKTRILGRELGLERDRLYADAEVMALAEAARGGGLDFAVIAAPNDVHYPAAAAFLSRGVNVVCDKPLALTVGEGESLAALARERGLLFCTTYTYTGYPAVKEARRLLASGAIGELRFVYVEYLQDWLARPIEREPGRSPVWRLDPARTGAASALGDIGTHAEQMVHYLTGRRILRVAARLEALVPGRAMDDTASIMAELEGGRSALIWTSQAMPGSSNALRIRLAGSEGSIEWRQEESEDLVLSRAGGPDERRKRGRDFGSGGLPFHRLPAGHPGGFYEALAGVYAPFVSALAARKEGRTVFPEVLDFPNAEDGVYGLKFVKACVESSRGGSAWTRVEGTQL